MGKLSELAAHCAFFLNWEAAEAELSASKGWDTAMEVVRYVLYVASPIPSSMPKQSTGTSRQDGVQTISRMPTVRRIAMLVAFVHCLEATAQDEVLEVLEMLFTASKSWMASERSAPPCWNMSAHRVG